VVTQRDARLLALDPIHPQKHHPKTPPTVPLHISVLRFNDNDFAQRFLRGVEGGAKPRRSTDPIAAMWQSNRFKRRIN